METKVKQIPCGKAPDGQDLILYRICHESGTYAEVLNYGCALRGLGVFERDRKMRNVIAASEDPANGLSGAVAGGVRIIGAGAENLRHLEQSVWQTQEIGENYVILYAESTVCGFGAAVKIRLMDHQRLVLDYAVHSKNEGNYRLTHSVPFRLCELNRQEQQKVRVFCPSCAGAKTLAECGYSSTGYAEVKDGMDAHFVSEGGRIHPMAELLAEETDLTLSVYSTMPELHFAAVDSPMRAVEITPLSGAPTAVHPEEAQAERTVFGVDLVYRPGAVSPVPFMFSGR